MNDGTHDQRREGDLRVQSQTDCGCSDSETSQSVEQSTSRRVFLKAIGTAAVSAATASLLSSHRASAETIPTETPPEFVEAALVVTRSDPMFVQAIDELRVWNLEFDITAKSTSLSSMQNSLVGLIYHQVKTDSPRFGGDLVVTVDLSKGLLLAVQYVFGWCLNSRLSVQSTTFDARLPLYREPRDGRSVDQESPLIRPRAVRGWDFLREDDFVPLTPEEMAIVGWPPETSKTCYWHYKGCSAAAWVKEEDGTLLLRCAQVIEEKSCKPDVKRLIDIDYTLPKPEPFPPDQPPPGYFPVT